MKILLVLGILFSAFGSTTFATYGTYGGGIDNLQAHVELLKEARQKAQNSQTN